MERPKSTANMNIGMKLTIGILAWTPMMLAPQPFSNMATMIPEAAPIDSTFMTAALRGTSTERNTHMSSRNDRATTVAMNRTNRLESRWEMSMNDAVEPPT